VTRQEEDRPPGPQGATDLTPEAAGRLICLRLLTTLPRTRAQLADALRRRGVPEDVAERVLDRLAHERLVDDATFARAWVESRHHGRGLSRRSLSAELRQRGVDGDDITDAVETLDPEREVETARRLTERKLAATRGQPTQARVRRVAGLLARKGYPSGLTFRLIREALEREGVDQDGLGDDALGGGLDDDEAESGFSGD
jgi:regulatory protein